jgi:hypothetical protein
VLDEESKDGETIETGMLARKIEKAQRRARKRRSKKKIDSIEMYPASLAEFAFPGGPAWKK